MHRHFFAYSHLLAGLWCLVRDVLLEMQNEAGWAGFRMQEVVR